MAGGSKRQRFGLDIRHASTRRDGGALRLLSGGDGNNAPNKPPHIASDVDMSVLFGGGASPRQAPAPKSRTATSGLPFPTRPERDVKEARRKIPATLAGRQAPAAHRWRRSRPDAELPRTISALTAPKPLCQQPEEGRHDCRLWLADQVITWLLYGRLVRKNACNAATAPSARRACCDGLDEGCKRPRRWDHSGFQGKAVGATHLCRGQPCRWGHPCRRLGAEKRATLPAAEKRGLPRDQLSLVCAKFPTFGSVGTASATQTFCQVFSDDFLCHAHGP